MRKTFFLLFIALFTILAPSLSYGQTTQVAREGGFFEWDFNTQNLTDGQVNRFEMSVDSGNWTNVGMTTGVSKPTTTTDSVFRAQVPALTLGTHTVRIRACNTLECGTASDTLTFNFLVRLARPGGMRIVIITPDGEFQR